mgnify:CR=1 FL=1
MNLICQQLYADLEKEKEQNQEFNESARVVGEQLKKEKEKTEDLQEKMEKFKNRLVAVEKAK